MQEQLFGTIHMEYCDQQFRMSTDSMVLADFCRMKPGASVLDAGCGCGALSLLLLGTYPDVHLTGVEILPDAAGQALENAKRNQLDDRFRLLNADLRTYRTLFAGERFDAMVSNPPYYPVGSGLMPASSYLSCARTEENLTLAELCSCASFCLKNNGSFFLVHKPERLTDLLCTLRQVHLEPKRMCFVHHQADKAASLVLLEARRNAGPGLKLEPNVVLHHADGSPTPQYLRIYHCQQESTP